MEQLFIALAEDVQLQALQNCPTPIEPRLMEPNRQYHSPKPPYQLYDDYVYIAQMGMNISRLFTVDWLARGVGCPWN